MFRDLSGTCFGILLCISGLLTTVGASANSTSSSSKILLFKLQIAFLISSIPSSITFIALVLTDSVSLIK